MRNQRKFTVVSERDEDGYYVGAVLFLAVTLRLNPLTP
jgi:hypothetical protein